MSVKQRRPRGSTGLSTKVLGKGEYGRQYYRLTQPGKLNHRWWSGLSPKQMGHTAYMRAYRALRKQEVQ